ncbi:MAG: prepilin-type N-terminal cleavage/methylation domain-containing protein [Phycisphaerales bacterium]|nr:prepilin-type N-terminal cleavage/methylation domain-containing protein [Phycisphaerales bacterium]
MHRPLPRRGFSLVELVVVVGIILVLLGLVLAVSTLVIQQAETRQVKAVFANLDSAVMEYETTIGRKLTCQPRGEADEGAWDFRYYNVLGQDVPSLEDRFEFAYPGTLCSCNADVEPDTGRGWERRIVRLMEILKRTDAAEEIISRIDPNLLVPVLASNNQPFPNGPSFTAVVDPWGLPIVFVAPGRLWRDGDNEIRDVDGTVRTEFEIKFGVCRNRTPLFVSCGPDGDPGCLSCVGSANSPRYQAAIDNIYSYEPEVQ